MKQVLKEARRVSILAVQDLSILFRPGRLFYILVKPDLHPRGVIWFRSVRFGSYPRKVSRWRGLEPIRSRAFLCSVVP